MAAIPENPLFEALSKFYEEYYLHWNRNFNYLMLDIVLSTIYQSSPSVHTMIDKVPNNNMEPDSLVESADNAAEDFTFYNSPNNFLYTPTTG